MPPLINGCFGAFFGYRIRCLERSWHKKGVEDTRTLNQIARDTCTYRLWDRTLLIAVVYPILLMLLQWAVDRAGRAVGGCGAVCR